MCTLSHKRLFSFIDACKGRPPRDTDEEEAAQSPEADENELLQYKTLTGPHGAGRSPIFEWSVSVPRHNQCN